MPDRSHFQPICWLFHLKKILPPWVTIMGLSLPVHPYRILLLPAPLSSRSQNIIMRVNLILPKQTKYFLYPARVPRNWVHRKKIHSSGGYEQRAIQKRRLREWGRVSLLEILKVPRPRWLQARRPGRETDSHMRREYLGGGFQKAQSKDSLLPQWKRESSWDLLVSDVMPGLVC